MGSNKSKDNKLFEYINLSYLNGHVTSKYNGKAVTLTKTNSLLNSNIPKDIIGIINNFDNEDYYSLIFTKGNEEFDGWRHVMKISWFDTKKNWSGDITYKENLYRECFHCCSCYCSACYDFQYITINFGAGLKKHIGDSAHLKFNNIDALHLLDENYNFQTIDCEFLENCCEFINNKYSTNNIINFLKKYDENLPKKKILVVKPYTCTTLNIVELQNINDLIHLKNICDHLHYIVKRNLKIVD